MNSEEWRTIAHHPRYEVSSHGRVRRADTKKLMRTDHSNKGYRRVQLSDRGTVTRRLVHHLVLEAFVGPRPDGMEACHFPDRNPSNCRLDNLRWDSRQGNHADKLVHGTHTRGAYNGMAKLNESDVQMVKTYLRAHMPQRAVARLFGVSQPTINDIAVGRTWWHMEVA